MNLIRNCKCKESPEVAGEGRADAFVVSILLLVSQIRRNKKNKNKNHHSNQLKSQGWSISAMIYTQQYDNLAK